MEPDRKQAASDWPFALMLDEVWLRVRRTLVHKLEKACLWIEASSYLTLIHEQQIQGENLKKIILGSALGSVDYGYLNGEAIFGSSNRRFRSRIPKVLSFGYELGYGIRFIGKDTIDEQDKQIAHLCALFNMGISVFDLMYDLYPGLSQQFTELFNEQTLDVICDTADVTLLQDAAVDELSTTEIRILLKLIAAFFTGVNTLLESNPDKGFRQELFALLKEAYRAEVQSVCPDPDKDLAHIVRAKSTLPFAVIHRLASILTSDSQSSTLYSNAVSEIMDCAATMFWLIDDVSDLVYDLQLGSVNSLFLTTSAPWCQASTPLVNYSVLAELLEGDAIADTTSKIVVCLTRITDILQDTDQSSHSNERLHNIFLAYIRNWLE